MIPAWPILGPMDPFLARQLGWVDGAIVSAPPVAMPVTGGSIAIIGRFDEAEARSLASLLDPATESSP
jgi:preprotein translocase subunit SecD